MWDLERMGAASGANMPAQPTTSFSGHAASVLSLDSCPAISCAATGSEDGTVRVWDVRTGAATHVINPWEGCEVAPSAAAQLQCLKEPAVPAVR